MSGRLGWTACFICVLSAIASGSTSKKLMCYYDKAAENRDTEYKLLPKDIDTNLCTHIVYIMNISEFEAGPFLLTMRTMGLTPQERTREIVELRRRKPNMVLMISVGGWKEGSSTYSATVADPHRRREFVRDTCNYVKAVGFDGIEINWQWPGHRVGGSTQDKVNFASFIKEMREYIEEQAEVNNKTALLLSVALPPFKHFVEDGFDVDGLVREADWLTLMTMDYHFSTEPYINHHAPLLSYPGLADDPFTVAATVEMYLGMGVPAEKLVLGIPTYGSSYILDSADDTEPGALSAEEGRIGIASANPGTLAYFEICRNLRDFGWSRKQPNATVMGPYAYKNDDWVAYDNAGIVRKKVKFAVDKGLGGVFLWTIDMDDFNGRCRARFPLVRAASEVLLVNSTTHSNKKEPKRLSKKVLCHYDKAAEGRAAAYALLPGDIDTDLCTHVLYVMNISEFVDRPFLSVSSRFGLNPEERTEEIVELRRRKSNIVLMISMGGWDEGSRKFSEIVSEEDKRSAFIRNTCQYLRDIGFDGVEINWQWPGLGEGSRTRDKDNFSTFIKELKVFIKEQAKNSSKPALILAVALPPLEHMVTTGFDLDTVSREVDLLTLMTMDYYSSNAVNINHHAPLYSSPGLADRPFTVDSTVKMYLGMGMDARKMVLGIPAYGRSYVLESSFRTQPNDPAEDEGRPGFATKTNGRLAYFEICINVQEFGWKEQPSGDVMGPFAYKSKDWVAYDDVGIVEKKVKYVIDHDLGGVFLWTIDMDDFAGKCNKSFTLANAIMDSLVMKKDKASLCDKVKAELNGNGVDDKDEEGKTAAIIAAEEGDLTTLECLVKLGADLGLADDAGQTALHAAAKMNRADVLEYLLEQGVTVDARDTREATPLYVSAEEGNLEAMLVLLHAEADPFKGPQRRTAMHAAATYGNVPVLRELNDKYGSMLNARDAKGDTPVLLAIRSCRFETVKELVSLGANIGRGVVVSKLYEYCSLNNIRPFF